MLNDFKKIKLEKYNKKNIFSFGYSKNYLNPKNNLNLKLFNQNTHWNNTENSLNLYESAAKNTASNLFDPLNHNSFEKQYKPKIQNLKINFYEFYFKSTSEKFNISIENFYDPLKKIYKNPGFKSFTSKYFKLLLESPNFKNDVTNLLESGKFLLNALLEYPKQFKKILSSVPTILIDQHKKKSKFLWTSYEFFFASYFFKKKVQI